LRGRSRSNVILIYFFKCKINIPLQSEIGAGANSMLNA